ncbi:hypothetical protein CROQUDRAFT_91077 [Cronartium quercuum f. sp. fusiforme G11]|uniref:Uncharacterized protein n=1 Tax=Cronartium quercuum f. sp. fusiforme G11 TaxID=708437 RepID=A0A9P6NKN4_9BASI|nr:hypothetical protein CROQUDRAFT_91077 [Cronartium quercuum f. sp. fusiforme G11]
MRIALNAYCSQCVSLSTHIALDAYHSQRIVLSASAVQYKTQSAGIMQTTTERRQREFVSAKCRAHVSVDTECNLLAEWRFTGVSSQTTR